LPKIFKNFFETKAPLEKCVKPILYKAYNNRDILCELFVISKEGKKYFELQSNEEKERFKNNVIKDSFGNLSPSYSQLENGIISNMKSAIKEGLGLIDKFKKMDEYPRQLKESIIILTKVLEKKAKDMKDEDWKKSLIDIRNKYKKFSITCKQAEEMEEIIVSLLIDAYIRTMPESERKKFEKSIEESIKKYGKEIGEDISNVKVGYILTHGGLIVLRQLLGFKFHILLAIVVNSIWNTIMRQGLSLSANALIQRIAAIALGPVGWILNILITIPIITENAKLRG